MVVKIEIKMPKCCADCEISLASHNAVFCPILGRIEGIGLKKDDSCPLMEVEK